VLGTSEGGGEPPDRMTVAAARPASAPAIIMTRVQVPSTFMPALRAALGFAPTARNWKPIVLRDSRQATPAAAAPAPRKARSACGGGPPTCGSTALPATGGAI